MIEELYQKFLSCDGVCTDTRQLTKNCMFFALKGENFDGNKYAKQAIAAGAKYAVIDHSDYSIANQTVLVPDVLKALQLLANHHRNQFNIPFLGITGSNGKTTTKELIRDVLKQKYNVLATVGNFNNHIGVPLTLLRLKAEHEFAIIEMGANHVGEIKDLSKIADPDFGLITNIGKAHIEGFGGVEGIKKGKSELYRHLENKNGLVFINNRDEVLKELLKGYSNIFSFGAEGSDVVVHLISANPNVQLMWKTPKGERKISMSIYGAYNFDNAAVAIAVGSYFNVDENDIIAALESYESNNNRSQLIKKKDKSIFLDAYNANPSSMTLAIQSFLSAGNDNKAVILGDMLELGEQTEEEHRMIIELLSSQAVSEVYLVGPIFDGLKVPSGFYTFKNVDELKVQISKKPILAQAILIKGSRRIGLEKAVEAIS